MCDPDALALTSPFRGVPPDRRSRQVDTHGVAVHMRCQGGQDGTRAEEEVGCKPAKEGGVSELEGCGV
jgi:hypothetical protein